MFEIFGISKTKRKQIKIEKVHKNENQKETNGFEKVNENNNRLKNRIE